MKQHQIKFKVQHLQSNGMQWSTLLLNTGKILQNDALLTADCYIGENCQSINCLDYLDAHIVNDWKVIGSKIIESNETGLSYAVKPKRKQKLTAEELTIAKIQSRNELITTSPLLSHEVVKNDIVLDYGLQQIKFDVNTFHAWLSLQKLLNSGRIPEDAKITIGDESNPIMLFRGNAHWSMNGAQQEWYMGDNKPGTWSLPDSAMNIHKREKGHILTIFDRNRQFQLEINLELFVKQSLETNLIKDDNSIDIVSLISKTNLENLIESTETKTIES